MIKINRIFIFAIFSLLAGCAVKPVKEGSVIQARWQTKARIKNSVENKTQSLDIDIYAIKGEKTRLEVSGVMGVNVASLVMSPSEISFILFAQKKYYFGKNSERALKETIAIPIHPISLSSIAFDEPIRGNGWRCINGPKGFISQCENSLSGVMVKWNLNQNRTKLVSIKSTQVEMEWFFSAPQTEVQFKPELFSLKQPAGFKAIQLN